MIIHKNSRVAEMKANAGLSKIMQDLCHHTFMQPLKKFSTVFDSIVCEIFH